MADKAGKVVMAAAAAAARSKGRRCSVQVSASSSSNLGKFFGIPVPLRSKIDVLVAKFVKLHNRQGRGTKKGDFTGEKLKELLSGKAQIGIPEIARLLSGQISGKTAIPITT